MGKYIKLFDTHVEYETYINGSDAILPNVSICTTEGDVHYNPYVSETRVVTKYNVTSTSSPTVLRTSYEQNIFKSMEIDGIMLDELVTEYTFDTTGVHTVKYELYDETKLGGNSAPTFLNSNLIEVFIPSSVTSIGNDAFYGCSGLTSINIPSGVTSIGDYAFDNCTSLTSINIPSGVTSINKYTFTNCISLTSIDIPSGVTSIGMNAFGNCPSLTSVTIGSGVTSIGDGAFNGCTSLTSIVIPNSVTSIDTMAFFNCSGLTSITIPNSVTSIGTMAFRACNSLTSMTVDSNNSVYDSRNNCNAIIETSTNTLVQGCNITMIPDSVTSIGSCAFESCTSLTSIDIPNSVTSINNSAFNGCTSLTSIDIPSGVTSIGHGAFQSCPSLTSVTIGSGVTSIGDGAFQGCTSLTSIDIPSGVTSISGNAFFNCSGLTSITCNAATAPTIQSNTFRNVKTGGTLTVPRGSSGYNVWMKTSNYYLGKYNWTKVEQ